MKPSSRARHARRGCGQRRIPWRQDCMNTTRHRTVFLNFFYKSVYAVTVEVILNMHCSWVYILSNTRHTVLYVGVTNDLRTRFWEHCTKQDPKSFPARFNLNKLIYFEGFESIVEAIAREKFIKGKSRKWKESMIEKLNPGWNDLSCNL
jgi:putative endonuclease